MSCNPDSGSVHNQELACREATPGAKLARAARLAAINGLFVAYKRLLSPALHALSPAGSACCYQPSCSEYAALAVAQHGVLRGGMLALWRILRCNPLSRGGWDPVPLAAEPRRMP